MTEKEIISKSKFKQYSGSDTINLISHANEMTIENLPHPVLWVTIQGKILYANLSACCMLGYSKHEIINMTLDDITDYFYKHPRETHWQTLHEKKHAMNQMYFKSKNREFFHVEANSIFCQYDKQEIEIISVLDLTRIRRAEKESRRAQNKLKTVLENLNEGLWSIDHEGRTTFINAKTKTMLGFDEKTFLKKRIFEFMDDNSQSTFVTLLRSAKKNTPQTLNINFIKNDGERIYTNIEISPVWDENLNYSGSFIGIVDITAQTLAQFKIEEQTSALSKKNIALQEILSQIEIEKNQLRENIHANIENVILPLLRKTAVKQLPKEYYNLLETNLLNIASPFSSKIHAEGLQLSPKETEICNLIKQGLSNKDISKYLKIQLSTVERHRNNIRKKLKIVNRGINLYSYLQKI